MTEGLNVLVWVWQNFKIPIDVVEGQRPEPTNVVSAHSNIVWVIFGDAKMEFVPHT